VRSLQQVLDEEQAEASPGRRKRRSPEEIRRRLLDAAREEFKAKGFAGATTAAIARRAEVAEIQMFRYFPAKADLFREAIFAPLRDHFRAFNAEHAPSAVDAASVMDGARLYVAELLAFLDDNARLLVSYFAAQSFERPGTGVAGDGLQAYLDEAAVAMAERTGGDDAGMFGRVAFGAVLGCITYRDWLFPEGSAEPARIDAAIAEFVLAGIGPHCDIGPVRK
jgi:AcrR family transcriptional regulator